MWTMYVKSLQKCSSVTATVTNTASNFFFTVRTAEFIISKLLDDETMVASAQLLIA